MKNIKYTALVLLLVFALIGGAYAAWSEELVITGSVETADFEVSFVKDSVVYSVDNVVYGPSVGWEYGNAIGVLSEDLKTLTVTLENVYPGYDIFVLADVEVKNSIPIQVRLTGPDEFGFIKDVNFISNGPPFSSEDVDQWIDISRLDAGGEVPWQYGVRLEVGDDAVPGETYEFTFTLQYRQGVGSQAFED